MAMSKAEKNARARARYAEKKAASGNTGRGVRMRFPVERFPTVKHGARYGGEGNQVGMIGPPRKYGKRTKKPTPAISALFGGKGGYKRGNVKQKKGVNRYGVTGGRIGPAVLKGAAPKSVRKRIARASGKKA